MSRYRFELASEADDADLRHILRETPMPGRIAVKLCREPSYFAAAAVDGHFRQVVAARDDQSGRLVGFGSRAIRELYVNGRPAAVGYLGGLRLLAGQRNRGLVARGYAFFRRLHADGRAPLYLTAIAEDNAVAQAVLTSRRAGLPAYHDAGRYHTAAVPLGRRERHNGTAVNGITTRCATAEDLPALLDFLESEGPRRQFFPYYQRADFLDTQGVFRDFSMPDVLLADRGGRLVGTLAGWDQHGFRQTIVHGYSTVMRWGRPWYNCWARLRGLPGLPAPGQSFRYLTAALPVVAGDDRLASAALLETLLARAAAGPYEYLLIGCHEQDPWLAVLRDYRATWYTTRLYLVCWEDGEALRATLDSRVPYLELGTL
jgi:hypothetical protein